MAAKKKAKKKPAWMVKGSRAAKMRMKKLREMRAGNPSKRKAPAKKKATVKKKAAPKRKAVAAKRKTPARRKPRTMTAARKQPSMATRKANPAKRAQNGYIIFVILDHYKGGSINQKAKVGFWDGSKSFDDDKRKAAIFQSEKAAESASRDIRGSYWDLFTRRNASMGIAKAGESVRDIKQAAGI